VVSTVAVAALLLTSFASLLTKNI